MAENLRSKVKVTGNENVKIVFSRIIFVKSGSIYVKLRPKPTNSALIFVRQRKCLAFVIICNYQEGMLPPGRCLPSLTQTLLLSSGNLQYSSAIEHNAKQFR